MTSQTVFRDTLNDSLLVEFGGIQKSGHKGKGSLRESSDISMKNCARTGFSHIFVLAVFSSHLSLDFIA